MEIVTTSYRVEDIDNYDEFLNKLYKGLNYYKKKNLDFKYTLEYDKNLIILKTIKLNESVN